MRLLPKAPRDFHRFDFVVLPPNHFVGAIGYRVTPEAVIFESAGVEFTDASLERMAEPTSVNFIR